MNGIAEIPLTDVGAGAAAALFDAHAERAAALIEGALGSHVFLPAAAVIADRLSRRWLERQGNLYLDEIHHVARRLGRPGVYFLNIVYEWACSTSAAPDPGGEGARMIRVLDWGLTGIGRHIVLARQDTAHGPFYNATWPGFAGVLTAMAPGRFAAAINQAPRVPILGPRWLDEMIGRVRLLRQAGAIPAAHLLRRVFEEARDYAGAQAMLADERHLLAAPALFTLSGVDRDQACVIEAIGRQRRIHRALAEDAFTIGAANDWLSGDLAGVPRAHAVEWSTSVSPRENNRVRRSAVCALQRRPFAGAADLAPPVINSHTVLVAAANAAAGKMLVEALDPVPGPSPLPQVVARRELRHAAPA
ncbi:MAG TPA: hypothetical protein VF502_18225 [Stellaceae bacterium]